MKTKISKDELKKIILQGISSEDLNLKYDYSHITNMSYMFSRCSSLASIPHLDTSNVTNMYSMFYKCTSLISIPHLDTSNVDDMYAMFSNCSSLTSIPHLDTSNVTNMSYMFDNCPSLICINPYNFMLYNFNDLDNKFIKKKYPELYI